MDEGLGTHVRGGDMGTQGHRRFLQVLLKVRGAGWFGCHLLSPQLSQTYSPMFVVWLGTWQVGR